MKHKPYRYLLYLGLHLLHMMVSLLPRRWALGLAEGVGRAAFWVARREREKTLQHLTSVYEGRKSADEIRRLAEQVFIHFSRMAADILHFWNLNLVELEGLVETNGALSVIDRVLSEGRGMILLTAHFGNWELMGWFLRHRGYEGVAVARRIYYEKFNQLLLDLRKKVSLKTLFQDCSPREFLEVLRGNQILALLADQDIDRLEGIFVPFFGRPTYTLTAPVRLALVSGAPLVPTFLVREGDRYRLLVEEPIRVELRGSREETIQEYTLRWSRVVEEKIRSYPEQWAWMHPRWKTQPEETVVLGGIL